MLHPLPKNVCSSRLVSTLAFTTHPPRCCEDHARLVAEKLANGKEPKEARREDQSGHAPDDAVLDGFVDSGRFLGQQASSELYLGARQLRVAPVLGRFQTIQSNVHRSNNPRGLSRSVEFCRAVELSSNVELLNSCLAVEPGNAYAYSFA
jgi:hypothetical protein